MAMNCRCEREFEQMRLMHRIHEQRFIHSSVQDEQENQSLIDTNVLLDSNQTKSMRTAKFVNDPLIE